VLWRLWGWRIVVVPAVASAVVGAVYGLWAMLGTVLAWVGLVYLANRQGWTEAIIAREETHRLKCRIRRTWHRAMRGAGLARHDLYPRRPHWMRSNDGTVIFRTKPVHGHHPEVWRAQASALATSWAAAEVEVEEPLSRSGKPTGQVEIHVAAQGVAHQRIGWPLPAGYRGTVLSALPIGRQAGGAEFVLSLVDPPHMLVAGPTGGGKSSFLNTLMCGLAGNETIAIAVIDDKGVDFNRWAPRLSALALNGREQAHAVLDDAVRLMAARAPLIADAGTASHQATPDAPTLVVIVDEFADIDPALHDKLDHIARRGRFADVHLVVCTQRPVVTLGRKFGDIRSQLQNRVALGVRQRAEGALILGEDAMPATWPTLRPGVARIQAVGGGRTVRVYWSNEHVDEIVAATADRRPRLPTGGRILR
jgi:hypothetical protein